MPKPIPAAPWAAVAAFLLFAACTDRSPTEANPAPEPGQAVRTEIACTVTVADARMRCEVPASAGGASANIILGGQGAYVRLESSNLSYDSATDVFSLDAGVQNLLGQPMGTPDGVTASGVKVFFEQAPVASEGTGDVTILNEDGEATFTGPMQPYFDYPQIVQPRGTTALRAWRFGVPGTVVRFGFKVYVSTELPAEQGVLRWRSEAGAAYSAFRNDLYGVWAGGVNDVFVAGVNQIFHWDGNDWTSFPLVTRSNAASIRDIAGSSRRQLFAAGSNGRVWLYDGNRWTLTDNTDDFLGSLEGVWARGDTVVAVGRGWKPEEPVSGGQILVSTDAGESFGHVFSGAPAGTRELWDVAGTSAANLWAVGFDAGATATGRVQGVVMHSTDAGATWTERVYPDEGNRYHGAAWAGPGRVVVGGGRVNLATGLWEAMLMESRDGGETWSETWFAVPGQNRYVREVWGTPGGTLHAVGNDGSTFIDTGSGWTDVTGATSATLFGLHGAGGEAWGVGTGGAVVRYRAGAWEAVDLKVATPRTLRSVWGSGPGNVYAVGHEPGTGGAERSVLLHSTGGGWSTVLAGGDSTHFADVWGSSSSSVYVVGHRLRAAGDSVGMIWRYDGSGWTSTALLPEGAQELTAVWGSGPGNVWVLGRRRDASGDRLVLLRSTNGGGTWSPSPVSGVPQGAVQVLDAWGSGPGNVYAVGYALAAGDSVESSMVLHYDGTSWTAQVERDGARLSGVWGSAQGSVFLVGYEPGWPAPNQAAGIIRRNAGADWITERFTGLPFANRRLLGVWGTSDTDVYAVGAGPVMHYDGVSWKEQGSYGWPTFRAVWGSSPQNVYAVGEKGVIVHGIR